jgi:flavin-dependent dehydrogenase
VVSGKFCAIGGNAGHINPITGGGDAESMVMGKLLGELIANNVSLEEYEYRYLRGALGQKHRRMYKLRLFLWSLSNKELDWLAKQLQGMKIDPEKKFKNLPGLVIKIILKKPHWALRLARPKVPKH